MYTDTSPYKESILCTILVNPIVRTDNVIVGGLNWTKRWTYDGKSYARTSLGRDLLEEKDKQVRKPLSIVKVNKKVFWSSLCA